MVYLSSKSELNLVGTQRPSLSNRASKDISVSAVALPKFCVQGLV